MAKHPGGRPPKFNKKLAKEICRRIAEGESLRAICRDEDMPTAAAVHLWLLDERKKEFFEQYQRAREIQAEVLFDDTLEIADETPDLIEGDDRSDGARVQASKLRVDTRKWYISKVLPKKYGEKLDLTSQGERIAGFNYVVPPNNDNAGDNPNP